MMRFYNQQHRFYCGIDLHARTLAVCILDADGAGHHGGIPRRGGRGGRPATDDQGRAPSGTAGG
jgi:hypothetical protein